MDAGLLISSSISASADFFDAQPAVPTCKPVLAPAGSNGFPLHGRAPLWWSQARAAPFRRGQAEVGSAHTVYRVAKSSLAKLGRVSLPQHSRSLVPYVPEAPIILSELPPGERPLSAQQAGMRMQTCSEGQGLAGRAIRTEYFVPGTKP